MTKSHNFYEYRGFLKALSLSANLSLEERTYIKKEIIPFLNLLSLDAKYHTKLGLQ